MAIESIARDITERREVQSAVRHRLAIEELIARLSTRFINVDAENLDAEIGRALQAVGEFAGVDRSYVTLLQSDGTTIQRVYEWCSEGTPPLAGGLAGSSLEPQVWQRGMLSRLEVVNVPRVADLPPEAAPEKQVWEGRGTRSVLCIPMALGSTSLGGFLGLNANRTERTWSEEDIRLLNLLGEVVISAVVRGRAERALRESEERATHQLASLNALYTSAHQLTESLDLRGVVARVTHQCVDIFGAKLATLNLAEPDGRLRLLGHYPPSVAFPTTISLRWDETPEGNCISGRAIRNGEAVVIPDIASDSLSVPSRPYVLEAGICTAASFPLISRDRTFGALTLSSDQPDFFTPERVDFFRAYAHQAGPYLENSRLFKESERRLGQLQALHSIDLAIAGSLDLRVTINTFLGEAISQLGVDAAAVWLLERNASTLQYAAGRGFRTRGVERSSLTPGAGQAGRVALERRLISIPDLSQVEGQSAHSLLPREEGFIAYVGMPLVVKGQVKGVLEIYHRSPLTLDQEWLDFMQALSSQAAIAIDSASLFDDLERSHMELLRAYDETIAGWSRALDLRDKETEDHTLRVTEVTLRLAQALGIRSSELTHMRRGVMLHDIGKMGVPDSILLKPGPLSEAEWEIMRRHPVYAYELLSRVAFLSPALDIPHRHHERWDGSGYPGGLKGRQIPLAARVFTVIDVWDALRSDRPYRTAWPEEKVRAYLREQIGKQFDPRVVEAFLKMKLPQ